jgi:hypothetical protein
VRLSAHFSFSLQAGFIFKLLCCKFTDKDLSYHILRSYGARLKTCDVHKKDDHKSSVDYKKGIIQAASRQLPDFLSHRLTAMDR